MSNPIRLFQIGQRGVDVVNKPQDLDESELVAGQNCEVATSGGGGALDQRPGMSKVGSAAMSGAVAMALDVPSQLLTDLTPYLYAGFYTGSTHNWRISADGATWLNDDGPSKPWSNNANIAFYAKDFPKAVTVNNRMYWADSNLPIQVHAWDGKTDTVVSTIPNPITGVTLATPNLPGIGSNGSAGATSYSYKLVATNGASHSAATAAVTIAGQSATLGNGTGGTVDILINAGALNATPVAGATAYDVYRTVGGATQGKIGSIPIVSGAFSTGNGSGFFPGINFDDGGLTGDSASAPSSASGATASNTLAVLDMITDGSSIYVAVLDALGSDPNPGGRILQFFPQTALWIQIGAAFPISIGNGTAGTLVLYGGTLSYATYTGITSGNTAFFGATGTPLPWGGAFDDKATAASISPCCSAVFNGDLYVGCGYLTTTAAVVIQRKPVNTYTSVLTAVAAANKNAYTSLGVFNGRLFAGWTSGGGATAANIYSTPDGVNWTLETTLATTDVPCQMAVFGSALYVVLGKTGIAYNTTSSIIQRTMAGVWSTVDDPSDALAGCLAVVYR